MLLDDIFDKLDDTRTKKLMKMVSEDDFGQIFITDTSRDRIDAIFKGINTEVKIQDVERGEVNS